MVTVERRDLYFPVFFTVFLLLLLIGVVARVSLTVSIGRAFLAAGFFTLLCWITGEVMSRYMVTGRRVVPTRQVVPGWPADSGTEGSQDGLGDRLDVTVAEPSPTNPGLEFTPLQARQIDPQLTKIIEENPQQAAEIVRKMGFEQKNL